MEGEVSDDGIGMSEKFQRVLFEPFTQESRDDVSERRGSGLGLAIVKRMVDLMGGEISVKSRMGLGTAFTIRAEFDCVPAEQAKKSRAESGENDYSRLSGCHVLLCEDHPLNQEIVKSLLNEKGMIVETAENCREGVAQFSNSPQYYYSVVLMDIRMPVMGGYEATREIRALPRVDAATVPIIAMTADAFEDDVKRCFAAGMDGHIAKPFEPEKLYAMLLKSLRERGK